MSDPQTVLREAINRRALERRVTNTALARAIGVDESYARRLLCRGSVLRLCFERHLVPWSAALGWDAVELVGLWAQAHGLRVDVVAHSGLSSVGDEEPTLVAVARVSEAAGQLATVSLEALADGVVTRVEAERVEAAGQRLARVARGAADRVARKAVAR